MRYWEGRLNWIVRALAQAPAEQRRLVPDFADAAEDLAVEFEASLVGAQNAKEPSVDDPALVALNEEIDRLSAADDASLWTDEALASSPSWEHVRSLARAVVKALGWAHESPGPDPKAVYVGPPNDSE